MLTHITSLAAYYFHKDISHSFEQQDIDDRLHHHMKGPWDVNPIHPFCHFDFESGGVDLSNKTQRHWPGAENPKYSDEHHLQCHSFKYPATRNGMRWGESLFSQKRVQKSKDQTD